MNIDAYTTPEQKQRIDGFLNAPVGGWKLTKIHKLAWGSTGRYAVQIENVNLKIWGVVLPDGRLIQPLKQRKTIDSKDIAIHL